MWIGGALGGILLIWDRRVVSKIDAWMGKFVAACSFKNVEDGLVWAFVGVYGPNSNNFRRFLLQELVGLMSLWDMPWCIVGDFNVTLFHNERSGGASMRRVVMDFAEFTVDQGLMDPPLAGGVSMWSNTLSWSRLDRFLISLEWELCYAGLVQKKLLHVCSNHTPILLTRGSIQNGKHYFKF
jgi:hypothetical protein